MSLLCRDVRAELSAHLDDELAPERRAEVDQHLAACAACAAERARLAATSARLSTWYEEDLADVGPPADLMARLAGAAEAEPRGRAADGVAGGR